MKSADEVRRMLKAICQGMEASKVNSEQGFAQVMALAWVLKALPEKSTRFQETILGVNDPGHDFRAAMAKEEIDEEEMLKCRKVITELAR